MPTYKEKVLKAVDDTSWQQFRKSLKGLATWEKIEKLRDYYDFSEHESSPSNWGRPDPQNCDVCIRVDNYLKALARGGQLTAPMSIEVAVDHHWDLQIRK